MNKIIIFLLITIGLSSCQKKTNYYESYVTQHEIDAELANQRKDIKSAEFQLFSANSKLSSATFFKPGDSFYSQSKVDEAKSEVSDAEAEYVRCLEVYRDALSNIVNAVAENPVDTVEYEKEIAITTYKISDNDYNYYVSKLKKIEEELNKYKH